MFGKILRIVGIVLLGITAVITLISGVGTTCVALDPVKYEMEAIAPYQWLYILYVVAGLIIGVMGILAVIALIKSKPAAYRAARHSFTGSFMQSVLRAHLSIAAPALSQRDPATGHTRKNRLNIEKIVDFLANIVDRDQVHRIRVAHTLSPAQRLDGLANKPGDRIRVAIDGQLARGVRPGPVGVRSGV